MIYSVTVTSKQSPHSKQFNLFSVVESILNSFLCLTVALVRNMDVNREPCCQNNTANQNRKAPTASIWAGLANAFRDNVPVNYVPSVAFYWLASKQHESPLLSVIKENNDTKALPLCRNIKYCHAAMYKEIP